LLETVVFGRRAGVAASQYIQRPHKHKDATPAGGRAVAAMEARVGELAARGQGAEDPYAIRAEMTTTMKDHFGVFREASTMQTGLDTMLGLKARVGKVGLRYTGPVLNLDLIRTVELEGMVDVALAIAAGALARTESRGSHSRTDYPERNDADWLKHTLATYHPEGPQLGSSPVTLGMFEPQERKY
jgi:succinate dehydrogenase / fumarate reductase flavoprotein subunit